MGVRRAVTMATVGAASAVSLVLSAGAASAATTGLTVWKDGQWRAHGTYNSDTRTLCVQGYNNQPGAQVDAWLRTATHGKGVSARGNGSLCRQIDGSDGFWSGRTVTFTVTHITPTLEVTQSQTTVQL